MRKTLGVTMAAIGLIATSIGGPASAATGGSAATGFAAQTERAGLSTAQVTALQTQVDGVLARYPGSRQVSANKVAADGLDIVVRAPGQTRTTDLAKGVRADERCAYGYLCISVGTETFNLYDCVQGRANNWYGAGYFINNQTGGTVATFYNEDGSPRWTSTAYEEGTFDSTPIGWVKPC